MILIDGGQGEGGGQVLRTALALALVTGKAFRIDNIRAKRSKPGLLRQHLTAVQAATAVGGAETLGATIGSSRLDFTPGGLKPGAYRFAVGTAGSATLVLQTILPPLLLAKGPSELVLEGGTHNPFAPPFDFLSQAFLPLLKRMGAKVEARLERHGFYPAGGGKFSVRIEPTPDLQPLELLERGAIVRRSARALLANLPVSIAQRELSIVQEKLGLAAHEIATETIEQNPGPGNVLLVELESEHVTEVFTGFGEKGRKAEDVARAAVDHARAYLSAGAPVGPHLADQLLIPLALAGRGRFRTCEPSGHTRTNLDVIRRFLGADIRIEAETEGKWVVEVR
ncbi:MAG: RNA 3'-terminal phosphate cyclase [Planctomycetota bacterium]